MESKGKLYVKIANVYVECTETIEDLQNKIKELESEISQLKIKLETKPIRTINSFDKCDKCGGYKEHFGKNTYLCRNCGTQWTRIS